MQDYIGKNVIFLNLAIGEAQNFIATFFQPSGSSHIISHVLFRTVLAAVQLHYQLGGGQKKSTT
jgi:hypothetical protein